MSPYQLPIVSVPAPIKSRKEKEVKWGLEYRVKSDNFVIVLSHFLVKIEGNCTKWYYDGMMVRSVIGSSFSMRPSRTNKERLACLAMSGS